MYKYSAYQMPEKQNSTVANFWTLNNDNMEIKK